MERELGTAASVWPSLLPFHELRDFCKLDSWLLLKRAALGLLAGGKSGARAPFMTELVTKAPKPKRARCLRAEVDECSRRHEATKDTVLVCARSVVGAVQRAPQN